VLLKAPFREPLGSLEEPGYQSVWVRLWTRKEGRWRVERWPTPEAIWEPNVVWYRFQTSRQQHMLQIGGPHIPWQMVSLPAAERLEVTIRPSGYEDKPGIAVTVATDN